MSQIRSRPPRFSNINIRFVSCAWCVCWLAFCLSTSTSSDRKTELFRNSYGPQIPYENLVGYSPDFVTEGTTSRVSAANKINLIRYYLGPKIPGQRVAVVVDTAEIFYESIKRLWNLVATGGRTDDDIMLFVYNETDCSLLPNLKTGNRTATELLDVVSASKPMSDVAESIFECVDLAIKMIDSDSSIILFTGRKPGDLIALGENTVKEMMKKRTEFNCIWCSDDTKNLEEADDYNKMAEKTNGHFLQFAKIDQDEITGNGVDPHRGYRTTNDAKSNYFSPDVDGTLSGAEIPGDETADLLYDPKSSGQRAISSFENPARIVTPEKNDGRKEALEIEDMELASITAIQSATQLEKTAVEVTAATSLVGTPGSVSRLTFTVTNNYPITIRHYFQGKSTSFNIVYLEPRNAWIESGKTTNVVADVLVPTTATSSTTGTVTLIIQSIGSIEKSAYIYVREAGSTLYDTARPGISYSFNNNCAGKLGSGTCSSNLWSVEVTVQDGDSGLQRVTSSPKGIQATTTFTSGTKSSTKFQYAATCCQTRVVITAEDLLGNSNSETIDVTIWWNLSMGEIIAIVMGTLLLLFILVLIIVVIICWIRRRKKSQELPFTQRVTRNIEA